MATVRSAVHRLLTERGITKIFGNPGSNELPFLTDLPDTCEYVLALHEGVAVGIADGYAQAKNETVLVNVHAASGTGNAMGALANAAANRTRMVVIAGQQIRSAVGLDAMLTNVDAALLTKPIIAAAAEPTCASDVPRAVNEAIFRAATERAPFYLSIPYDDWDAPADDNVQFIFSRSVRKSTAASEVDVAWLSGLISSSKHLGLVFGDDIDRVGGFDQAVALAEALNAPTWVAPSHARLSFPNRHPLFRGVLPAGIRSIADALGQCDNVLVFGAPVFRYHQSEPGEYMKPGTTIIQVTDDAAAAARAPMGHALVADPLAVMSELITWASATRPAFTGGHALPPFPPPLSAVEPGVLHPQEVFHALRVTQPARTAYVVESTSTKSALWAQMDFSHQGSYFAPAAGGLGFGIPAAVGIQMADPDRPVVGIIGDGSANYGITGLWTAAHYNVPVTFVILRNGSYSALRWFAEILGTNKVPGLNIPGIDFIKIAEGYGVRAVHAHTLAELVSTLEAATTTRDHGPLLIEVDTAVTNPR